MKQLWCKFSYYPLLFLLKNLFIFNCRIIGLQYCVCFCHTSLLYYSFNVCSIYGEFPALIYIGNVSMFLFFLVRSLPVLLISQSGFVLLIFLSVSFTLFLSLSWYSLFVSVSFYLSLFFSLSLYIDTFYSFIDLCSFLCFAYFEYYSLFF